MLGLRAPCIVAIVVTLPACAPLATHESRAAHSSLGCMRAALAEHDFTALADGKAHCVASGLIALRCSTTEAWLAGVGKEIKDLFGRGDADWDDLRADARGIRCAHSATNDRRLLECCESVMAVSSARQPTVNR